MHRTTMHQTIDTGSGLLARSRRYGWTVTSTTATGSPSRCQQPTATLNPPGRSPPLEHCRLHHLCTSAPLHLCHLQTPHAPSTPPWLAGQGRSQLPSLPSQLSSSAIPAFCLYSLVLVGACVACLCPGSWAQVLSSYPSTDWPDLSPGPLVPDARRPCLHL